MKTDLEPFILSINNLDETILQDVTPAFRHYEYPKGYFLLKAGKVCDQLWFMTKGCVRYFYTDENGKEANTLFSLDEQIVTDTISFVTRKPAQESIQVVEDASFYAIDCEAIQRLLKKHHAFALWYIKLVEKHYIEQVEDRIADLQFLDAKQRYEKLTTLYPSITNRISLGHIASYLNITQETLSRIRSGKL